MRQETNNEIDLLLRRMSRQNGGSLRDGEAHEQHLDADELSSYAQNALPPAARARYMEHVADCSMCRKLVTELSLSLGATAVAAAPVEAVAEASGLKKFLASLFSPMVLRYAVPALGLIVVAAIGFVILRQRGEDGFVAQLDSKQNSTPVTTAPGAAAPTSSPNTVAPGYMQPDQSGRVANLKEAPPKSGEVAGDVAGAGPGAVAPAPAPVATPARTEDTVVATAQPTIAAEPPPAKLDAVTENETQKKQEQKSKDAVAKKAAEPTVAVQAADTPVKTTRANEPARDNNTAPQTGAERADESKREAMPVQRSGTFGGVTSAGRRARAQTDKDDAETRTVSGRRFRKERGIWTDTAYDSSTPIMSVARNSERFRSLVADEPEIKKIAEQLDGEVIVVWKGRAYRIR